MNVLFTKRFPCSVCGLTSHRHDGWFQVIENRWLDRLRILTWHDSLATQTEIRSACSRHHLRILIGYWLEEASLRLLPHPDADQMPLAGTSTRQDIDLDARSAGYLLGELSVHRETFARSWAGSPAAFEGILDALMPAAEPTKSYAPEMPLFNPAPSPHLNSPFIKALADLRRSLMQV
ncbi:MAG: hypothetical protein ABSD39_18600 [Terriglobales bacterium]|jgi:hypothetical protein